MRQEKKLNNSVVPVSISNTKAILHQLMDCICKLNINGAYGTGFFCKIPFQNNKTKIFLMTNYHILDKSYYKKNNNINLLINDEKEIKTIDLRIKRNTYFNEDNNITLIELNENDNIKYYLELDDNLFRHNNNILYENKSLYVLQYPQGRNAAVSYGLLTYLDKYEIKHICSTENGSSGSPILNLETNKVIGIHKEGSTIFDFNKGTYLKYILIDFIQNNKNQIKSNKNIIHNIPSTKIEKNYSNNKNKGLNIKTEVNNNFNHINNFNNVNKNILIDQYEEVIYDDRNTFGPKMNVIFENIDHSGTHKIQNLILNKNRTVDEMLKIFLKGIKNELIVRKTEPNFSYNSEPLYFGDKTLISQKFKLNSIIYVIWPKEMLGALILNKCFK